MDEFVIVVMPALVAAVAHKRRQISVPTLAEEALQHHAIYAKAARSKLTKKVERAARIICDRDPESFEFRDRTALRDFASILIHRSPETAARQGRTQSYQAIARRAGRKEPRRRRAPGEDQMALFDDLIDELSADARSDPAEPEEPT